jgi:hypothetical protein
MGREAQCAMNDRSRPPPILRKGSTRAVLVIGPLALKLGLGERGRRCNHFEARLYRRVNAHRRAMLCPVLWCNPNGTVLVMRAARPLTEAEKVRLMATRGFPDWDYVPPDESEPFEYKASDWGWLDGCLVALDYSSPALFEDTDSDASPTI